MPSRCRSPPPHSAPTAPRRVVTGGIEGRICSGQRAAKAARPGQPGSRGPGRHLHARRPLAGRRRGRQVGLALGHGPAAQRLRPRAVAAARRAGQCALIAWPERQAHRQRQRRHHRPALEPRRPEAARHALRRAGDDRLGGLHARRALRQLRRRRAAGHLARQPTRSCPSSSSTTVPRLQAHRPAPPGRPARRRRPSPAAPPATVDRRPAPARRDGAAVTRLTISLGEPDLTNLRLYQNGVPVQAATPGPSGACRAASASRRRSGCGTG